MAAPSLQRTILLEAAAAKPRLHRRLLEDEYKRSHPSAGAREVVESVTKAIERLIARGLAVGYGYKTQHKLFLTSVRLTPAGKRLAKSFGVRQQTLPLFRGRHTGKQLQ